MQCFQIEGEFECLNKSLVALASGIKSLPHTSVIPLYMAILRVKAEGVVTCKGKTFLLTLLLISV